MTEAMVESARRACTKNLQKRIQLKHLVTLGRPIVTIAAIAAVWLSLILPVMAAKLVWDRNAETDLAGYHVYTCQTVGCTATVSGTPTATVTQPAVGTVPLWPLPANSQGAAVVTAFNTSGQESGPSNMVSFNLLAPGAPSNVCVSSQPVAVTRIGGIARLTNTSNSGSAPITVPPDAEIIVVGVSGYQDSAGFFSTGNVTLNGVAMKVVPADADTSAFMGSLFYLVSPATGTQTLAWDWAGTTAPNDGVLFAYGFYKGINKTSPIRASSGIQQQGNPHAITALTAQSGDLIVAMAEQFTFGTDLTFSWTGAKEVQSLTNFGTADGSWAEASPTGSQAVSATTNASSDGGIMAIVLKPAGSL